MMIQKVWQVKSPNIEKSSALAVGLGVSPLVAQLLVNRGIETCEAAQMYLHPTFANLHNPFLLHDMQKAVDRIHSARQKGEHIWIFGDYDTDGTTAAALLLGIFNYLGISADFYIPNRFEEGYGLNEAALKTLRDKGCDLLITVDCGITSVDEIKLANESGIDVIVTDHHQARPDELPPAYAVVTPNMDQGEFSFDELAGVGVAFKLAHGLLGGGELTPPLISQLDLVVLGTVVDVARLTGENRTLTKLGLVEINRRNRPGIRALCDVADYSDASPIVGHTLQFLLGPRINAAGRMDTAEKVVQLLTTESYEEARLIADQLDANNVKRREIEARIQGEAVDLIELDMDLSRVKGLVLAHEGWHPGVIGIVASRLLERYYRPVFLLSIDGDEAHGSGRAIEGINLADSLNTADHLLLKHGGHKAAAGLTIKTKNIEEFQKHFNRYACEHLSDEDLVPKLDLDLEIQASHLTLDTIEELDLLEPFGQANQAPKLAIRGLTLQRPPRLIGKGNEHLKLSVTDGEQTLEAVGWRMSDFYVALKNQNIRMDIAGVAEINEWNDMRRVQLVIKDLHIHAVERHRGQEMFPLPDADGPVKLVDCRQTNKGAYLAQLFNRNQRSILYVRDRTAIDQLIELIDLRATEIGQCDDETPESEIKCLMDSLAQGKLLAVVSSCTLIDAPESVDHVVFCHPVSKPLTFFNRCQTAFKSPETTYIHLVYNAKDVESMRILLSWQYPDEEALKRLYQTIKTLRPQNDESLSWDEIVVAAHRNSIPLSTVHSGLTIFEELGLLKRQGTATEAIAQLLPTPSVKRELHQSNTFLSGEQSKQASALFSEFQLKQSIQEIWKKVIYECRSSN